MLDFQKTFEAYGCNYDAAMKNVLGDEALYLKMLERFLQDKNMEQLGNALEAGNLVHAFNAANILKNCAGNMGLDPLYLAVRSFEELLHEDKQGIEFPAFLEYIKLEYREIEKLRDHLSTLERR